MELRIDDRELRAILDRADTLAARTARALELRLHRHWAPKVSADADRMCPEQFSILKGSRQTERIPGGFRITYGGLASEYAAKQHEDATLHHRPPTNKFSYEGPFGGDKPGALNPPRKGGKAPWRYQHVQYGRRSLRTDHPIKATATHHWLFGESFSAYESNLPGMIDDLTNVGRRAVERLLRNAA